ncbi:DUF4012 domain-containing protein [Nakamurella lactea]|uniref:DUF4012 domain-containing protein n=1 Tax=Nakamurella lactea TaxID=459515 RepID=UPI0004193BC6|nr:DUF4012 domain-containing protein [Nakamurella lactea]
MSTEEAAARPAEQPAAVPPDEPAAVPPEQPAAAPPDEPTDKSPIGAGRKRRRLRGRILLGLGILLLAVVGWVGFRAYQAYHHLTAAKGVVADLQTEFDSHGISEPDTLIALAGKLRDEAAAARSAVDDPLYRLATVVPWLGDNLDAVGQVSRAVDAVAAPLPAAAELTRSLDAGHLLPKNGAMDLAVVQSGATSMLAMDGAVKQAQALVAGVDRSHLVGPVDDAVALFQQELPRVERMTDAGARLGRLVGPMLGADGPRTYLLVFQNLAEPRATGGIFGSYAAIRIDDGKMSITAQGAASRDIPVFDPPIEKVDAATTSLYTDLVARYPTDVNFTPDFPSAASTFAKMYTARTGSQVDGVVAIDPMVVSRMLVAHDPITLADGQQLDSANAVEFLLSGIYQQFPRSGDVPARDAYLGAATAAVFQALTSGGGDLRVTVSNTKDMVDQRRVLIWSAHPTEQAEILTTAVSGRLPDDPLGVPSVGVFVNDGSGSKLGYYLDAITRLSATQCHPDGSRQLALSATFANDAPKTGLSPYVLGGVGTGKPYQLRTNILLFAPTGGSLGAVLVDGTAVPTLRGTDHGRQVAVVTLDLMPGQKATVTADLAAPDPGDGSTLVDPRLITTPGPRLWDNHAERYPACAPATP